MNIKKQEEFFKNKYGYDTDKRDCTFTINRSSDGHVSLTSGVVASIPLDENFGEGQLKKRLESIWKDMIHLLEIDLDRINSESFWYKPNQIEEKK